jgi:urease accessory protein UreH
MEQHASLILGEQLQAGLVKITKRVKYELTDEKLQILASTFDVIPRNIYFKRARALFNF